MCGMVCGVLAFVFYLWGCRVDGTVHTPSHMTLTNDPMREARKGYFLHLKDAKTVVQ